MRYITAILYAFALGSHTEHLVRAWVTAGCVALGTVAMGFAIEGIVRHEINKALRETNRGLSS